MSNESLSDRFRSLLQCPICHEQYNVPKTLPCMHRFCEECLNKHILHNGHNFRCPFCNVGTDKLFITRCMTAASLRTNCSIESLFDICRAVEKLEKGGLGKARRLKIKLSEKISQSQYWKES